MTSWSRCTALCIHCRPLAPSGHAFGKFHPWFRGSIVWQLMWQLGPATPLPGICWLTCALSSGRPCATVGGGGGGGWQEYDRSFRNQAAIDPTLRWNTLLPDLQASTILGHGMGRGTYCSLCRGVDHQAAQCALTYLQQPLVSSQQSPTAAAISRPPTDSRSRASRPAYRICTSWNLGSCIYPGTCTFRHICLVCRQSHRAKDCPDAPADSFHRRTPRPAAPTSAASAKRWYWGRLLNLVCHYCHVTAAVFL